MGSAASTSPPARVTVPARASKATRSPSAMRSASRQVSGGHAQVAQGRRRLFARGADAEVRPGHHHVAGLHAGREVGPQRLQAVLRDHVHAVLHPASRCERVGVDVRAEAPHAMGLRAHASTSRASAMRPAIADAATV